MLWCAACCEPYHIYCLQPEDLPLPSKDAFGDKNLQDWICRRCSLCRICGLPGDIESDSTEKHGINEISSLREKDGGLGKMRIEKSEKYLEKSDNTPNTRKRLRCTQCEAVFHSDCLQPSQQKMIKAQGERWVRFMY